MKARKFTISSKSIFIVSILVLAIISGGLLLPQVIAEHGQDGITLPLSAGPNTVNFRDITDLSQSINLDVDTFSIKAGFFTITVEEEDSNLDSTAIDVILSSATSTANDAAGQKPRAITSLSETGPDSGVFTGTIQVTRQPTEGNKLELQPGQEILVTSVSESLGISRIEVEIEVSNDASVTISDDIIVNDIEEFNEFVENQQFRPVTFPVKLEFTGGATLADIQSIKFSCMNARWNLLDNPANLHIFLKPTDTNVDWFEIDGAGNGFVTGPDLDVVVSSGFPPIDMLTECTIFSDLENSTFDAYLAANPELSDFPLAEGEFVIGFSEEFTTGGGGGGGLVRKGLVVNAILSASSLRGLFTGGTGSGPTNPTFGNGSMSVLGSGEQGFGGIISGGDENPFDTITVVEVGEKLTARIPLYENQGINNIEQVIWYLNFAGENYDRSSIDTYILFDRGVVTVVDPHEKLESANIEILQEDGWNLIVKGELVFKNTMTPSNFLFYSVDLDRNFGEILIPNALEVIESSILLADEQKEIQPALQLTTTEDMTEVKLTEIPLWVKSNALWWQQKQIDDSDFIAGIEYLIQKAIINIDDEDISRTGISQDIPSWIQDVAGFWANDSMTDDEFVQAMQWLISKGIITVQT